MGFPSLNTELRRSIIKFLGERGEAPLFTIHKELGYPAISVGRACGLLEERGYLASEVKPGRGPRKTKTVYSLTDLGRLAYLVLTWDGLDHVLREALDEFKLPLAHLPSVDAWLGDPCLRELLMFSVCRAVQLSGPEENHTFLKREFGDVLKTIVFGGFIMLWTSASSVLIESVVEEVLGKEKVAKEPAREAVYMVIAGALGPSHRIQDPLVREEFAKIEREKKSETAVEIVAGDLPNYLKFLISSYSMSLISATLLLDAYERNIGRRTEVLRQALKQALGDVVPYLE